MIARPGGQGKGPKVKEGKEQGLGSVRRGKSWDIPEKRKKRNRTTKKLGW